MVTDAQGNEKKALVGHLGTHFDVMNKEFPLEYTKRSAVVFDVSDVGGRDIDITDVDLSMVKKDMFVAFYTGFIEKIGYGGKVYFTEHPQLSDELIDALLDKGVSIIGVDFAGVRRSKEHTPKGSQRCILLPYEDSDPCHTWLRYKNGLDAASTVRQWQFRCCHHCRYQRYQST